MKYKTDIIIGIVSIIILIIGILLMLFWFIFWENKERTGAGGWAMLTFGLFFIALGLGLAFFSMIKMHQYMKLNDPEAAPIKLHIPTVLGLNNLTKEDKCQDSLSSGDLDKLCRSRYLRMQKHNRHFRIGKNPSKSGCGCN